MFGCRYGRRHGQDREDESLHRFLAAVDDAVARCDTLEQRLVEGRFTFVLTYLRGHQLLNRLLRPWGRR